jgi:hypothetical protein
MRYVCLAALCALAAMLVGCGGGNSSGNALTGNWSATLNNSSGTAALTFNATLTQGTGTISVTNLVFTSATNCFVSSSTASATLDTTGANATQPFQLTLISGTIDGSQNNQLTMDGTPGNNTITGTWELSGNGPGCMGSGAFSMTKM